MLLTRFAVLNGTLRNGVLWGHLINSKGLLIRRKGPKQ